jgi:hypothetical protein
MNKKRAIVVLCLITICLVGTLSVFGQEEKTDLKDKRITITVEAQPLGTVFKYLMEKYDITIGFEESDLDREHSDYYFETNLAPGAQHKMSSDDGRVHIIVKGDRSFNAVAHPITLYVENQRLEEVFDEIVRQMGNYKWEINDDVVNIFPVKGRNKKFEELLGMNVSRFTLEKGKTVDDITKNIMALPEFVSFMNKNKLRFNGLRSGNFDFVTEAQYGRVINEGMDFSNLTFRDLLNKATKVKRGGWVLRWKRVLANRGAEPTVLDINI